MGRPLWGPCVCVCLFTGTRENGIRDGRDVHTMACGDLKGCDEHRTLHQAAAHIHLTQGSGGGCVCTDRETADGGIVCGEGQGQGQGEGEGLCLTHGNKSRGNRERKRREHLKRRKDGGKVGVRVCQWAFVSFSASSAVLTPLVARQMASRMLNELPECDFAKISVCPPGKHKAKSRFCQIAILPEAY